MIESQLEHGVGQDAAKAARLSWESGGRAGVAGSRHRMRATTCHCCPLPNLASHAASPNSPRLKKGRSPCNHVSQGQQQQTVPVGLWWERTIQQADSLQLPPEGATFSWSKCPEWSWQPKIICCSVSVHPASGTNDPTYAEHVSRVSPSVHMGCSQSGWAQSCCSSHPQAQSTGMSQHQAGFATRWNSAYPTLLPYGPYNTPSTSMARPGTPAHITATLLGRVRLVPAMLDLESCWQQ